MSKLGRIGVILAAGRGGRMGGTKQLKPWRTEGGEKPLIAAAYDAIHPICDEIVVVLGHEAAAVAVALGDRPFHRALSDANQPMFESIRAGLRAAFQIDAGAKIVLHPGDHPEVAGATLNTITGWSLQRPAQAVIPEHAGRGGHPVLIPAKVAALIAQADCPEGLGKFWTEHPKLCVRVPVDDRGVVRDIDTPADFAG